jgi:hypothetical protein
MIPKRGDFWIRSCEKTKMERPHEILERVKGIEPSYSAWKLPDFRNVFKAVLTFFNFLGD